jgi:hypothetical protein
MSIEDILDQIARNVSKRYYIGFTENIDQRVKEHNEGKSLHTAKVWPVELAVYLAVPSKTKALDLERYLKLCCVEVNTSGRGIAPKPVILELSGESSPLRRGTLMPARPKSGLARLAALYPSLFLLIISHLLLPFARASLTASRDLPEESKLVLRIKRQFDHSLEKLIPWNAAKISQHELFDIEPYEIAQFERLGPRGEHEITMAVVHDDHVARRIEAGTPWFTRRALEGISGKTACIDDP